MPMTSATKTFPLTNFNEEDPKWYTVNDDVMGGVSTSNITSTKNGTGIFKGYLSLENNGGFASSRMQVERPAPEGLTLVRLRVRGDGNRYNFRIRKGGSVDGLAYDLPFDTINEEWIEVELHLAEFQGTYRGRKFSDKIGVDSKEISQIGVLIANKQEGSFTLEIDWIELVK